MLVLYWSTNCSYLSLLSVVPTFIRSCNHALTLQGAPAPVVNTDSKKPISDDKIGQAVIKSLTSALSTNK